MSAISLSGDDSVVINNQVLSDFADGNVVELTFPNDIAQLKVGKNQNAIYGFNATGQMAEVKLRLIRGSKDDQFMNSLLIEQNSNFAGFPLMIGTFVKKLGDGAANITSDTYILSGGIFQKQVEALSNVEGETTQSVSIYMMKFAQAPRAIT